MFLCESPIEVEEKYLGIMFQNRTTSPGQVVMFMPLKRGCREACTDTLHTLLPMAYLGFSGFGNDPKILESPNRTFTIPLNHHNNSQERTGKL